MEEQHKICSGGEKMRNASGHLGENERQWKKKKKNTYDNSPINRVTRKPLDVYFTLWSCKTTAEKCTRKVCFNFKVSVAFLLIRPIF